MNTPLFKQYHNSSDSDEQFLRKYHRLQQSSNSKDEEKIDSLEQKINRIDNAVYQLIGGLYNLTTNTKKKLNF